MLENLGGLTTKSNIRNQILNLFLTNKDFVIGGFNKIVKQFKHNGVYPLILQGTTHTAYDIILPGNTVAKIASFVLAGTFQDNATGSNSGTMRLIVDGVASDFPTKTTNIARVNSLIKGTWFETSLKLDLIAHPTGFLAVIGDLTASQVTYQEYAPQVAL